MPVKSVIVDDWLIEISQLVGLRGNGKFLGVRQVRNRRSR